MREGRSAVMELRDSTLSLAIGIAALATGLWVLVGLTGCGSIGMDPAGLDPKQKAPREASDEFDFEGEWLHQLRPYTMPEAREQALVASTVQIEEQGAYQGIRGVAWGWIQENCNRRASMVDFALAQHGGQLLVPDPFPLELVEPIAGAEIRETARIKLAGPLNRRERHRLPDGTTTEWGGVCGWDHHVASAIRIKDQLGDRIMVLDLSLAKEPVDVSDWIDAYISEGTDCVSVDEGTFRSIAQYYIMRELHDATPPEHACGFTLEQAFGIGSDEPFSTEAIAEEMEGARELLFSNFEYLRSHLYDELGLSVPYDVIPLVEVEVVPLTDEEYCDAATHKPRWCGEDEDDDDGVIDGFGDSGEEDAGPTVIEESGVVWLGEWVDFGPFEVSGGQELTAIMTGDGDADLYVRVGGLPTEESYDCRPYLTGSDEECIVPGGPTPIYVSVHGYADVSNYSLRIEY